MFTETQSSNQVKLVASNDSGCLSPNVCTKYRDAICYSNIHNSYPLKENITTNCTITIFDMFTFKVHPDSNLANGFQNYYSLVSNISLTTRNILALALNRWLYRPFYRLTEGTETSSRASLMDIVASVFVVILKKINAN